MSGRARVYYQVSWTTLPGLRGLGCSEFRATPTASPDSDRGVAIEFSSDAERDAFLAQLEQDFGARRFTSASDAFDTVKAAVLERAARHENDTLDTGNTLATGDTFNKGNDGRKNG
jgi:hypothetical protein